MSLGDSTSRACAGEYEAIEGTHRSHAHFPGPPDSPKQRASAPTAGALDQLHEFVRHLDTAFTRLRRRRRFFATTGDAVNGIILAARSPSEFDVRGSVPSFLPRHAQARVAAHYRTRPRSLAHGARPRACCRPRRRACRARVDDLARAARRCENLHPGPGAESLRRTSPPRRGQHLGDARLAQGPVGKEQVVVHDTTRPASASRRPSRHALAELRQPCEEFLSLTMSTSGLTCAFVRAIELGRSPCRHLRPLLDLGQRAHRPAVGMVAAGALVSACRHR